MIYIVCIANQSDDFSNRGGELVKKLHRLWNDLLDHFEVTPFLLGIVIGLLILILQKI